MENDDIKEKRELLERKIDKLKLEFIMAVKRNEDHHILMKMRQSVKVAEHEYKSLL